MKTINVLAVLLSIAVPSASHAGLIFRDVAGVKMVYDQDQNITWMLDASLSLTMGVTTNNYKNRMQWEEARSWARGMSVGGFSDWRLPKIEAFDDQGNDLLDDTYSYSGTDYGYNVDVNNSEFAYMYYIHLKNVGEFDESGNTTGGPFNSSFIDAETGRSMSFKNLSRDTAFWSRSEWSKDPERIWTFSFQTGDQHTIAGKSEPRLAWLVRDGDVFAVPEPATVGIFGLVIFALGRFRRS